MSYSHRIQELEASLRGPTGPSDIDVVVEASLRGGPADTGSAAAVASPTHSARAGRPDARAAFVSGPFESGKPSGPQRTTSRGGGRAALSGQHQGARQATPPRLSMRAAAATEQRREDDAAGRHTPRQRHAPPPPMSPLSPRGTLRSPTASPRRRGPGSSYDPGRVDSVAAIRRVLREVGETSPMDVLGRLLTAWADDYGGEETRAEVRAFLRLEAIRANKVRAPDCGWAAVRATVVRHHGSTRAAFTNLCSGRRGGVMSAAELFKGLDAMGLRDLVPLVLDAIAPEEDTPVDDIFLDFSEWMWIMRGCTAHAAGATEDAKYDEKQLLQAEREVATQQRRNAALAERVEAHEALEEEAAELRRRNGVLQERVRAAAQREQELAELQQRHADVEDRIEELAAQARRDAAALRTLRTQNASLSREAAEEREHADAETSARDAAQLDVQRLQRRVRALEREVDAARGGTLCTVCGGNAEASDDVRGRCGVDAAAAPAACGDNPARRASDSNIAPRGRRRPEAPRAHEDARAVRRGSTDAAIDAWFAGDTANPRHARGAGGQAREHAARGEVDANRGQEPPAGRRVAGDSLTARLVPLGDGVLATAAQAPPTAGASAPAEVGTAHTASTQGAPPPQQPQRRRSASPVSVWPGSVEQGRPPSSSTQPQKRPRDAAAAEAEPGQRTDAAEGVRVAAEGVRVAGTADAGPAVPAPEADAAQSEPREQAPHPRGSGEGRAPPAAAAAAVAHAPQASPGETQAPREGAVADVAPEAGAAGPPRRRRIPRRHLAAAAVGGGSQDASTDSRGTGTEPKHLHQDAATEGGDGSSSTEDTEDEELSETRRQLLMANNHPEIMRVKWAPTLNLAITRQLVVSALNKGCRLPSRVLGMRIAAIDGVPVRTVDEVRETLACGSGSVVVAFDHAEGGDGGTEDAPSKVPEEQATGSAPPRSKSPAGHTGENNPPEPARWYVESRRGSRGSPKHYSRTLSGSASMRSPHGSSMHTMRLTSMNSQRSESIQRVESVQHPSSDGVDADADARASDNSADTSTETAAATVPNSGGRATEPDDAERQPDYASDTPNGEPEPAAAPHTDALGAPAADGGAVRPAVVPPRGAAGDNAAAADADGPSRTHGSRTDASDTGGGPRPPAPLRVKAAPESPQVASTPGGRQAGADGASEASASTATLKRRGIAALLEEIESQAEQSQAPSSPPAGGVSTAPPVQDATLSEVPLGDEGGVPQGGLVYEVLRAPTEQLGLDLLPGLVVNSILTGGPAARDLPASVVGRRVVDVDGTPVSTIADVRRCIADKARIRLRFA